MKTYHSCSAHSNRGHFTEHLLCFTENYYVEFHPQGAGLVTALTQGQARGQIWAHPQKLGSPRNPLSPPGLSLERGPSPGKCLPSEDQTAQKQHKALGSAFRQPARRSPEELSGTWMAP